MIFTFDSIKIKDLCIVKNVIGYYLDIDKSTVCFTEKV